MAEKKEKRYVSDNARLMVEWNWGKNNELGLYPHALTCGSGKKVWWECCKGHEWKATICDKNNGNGCPYCSGRFAIKGKTDLQTLNPTLAKEWNYDKNIGLLPLDVTPNSNKIIWWKCNEGHEWQAKPNARSRGTGCPYCSSIKVLEGYNDLQTINPMLAKEWNYDKNQKLTPSNVMANSNKKVWWKCSKGHEWKTVIAHRNNGTGCPVCNSERNTSLPEYAIVYYLRKCGLNAIHSYKEKGYELDVYIPSKNIAIEYDGYFWHKNKVKKDLEKNQKCVNSGIKLYRIREGLFSLNDSSIDYVVLRNQKDFSQILEKLLSDIVGDYVDVDIDRDVISIERLREYTEKEDSLFYSHPQIVNEWDYVKNGYLNPVNFSSNSTKKFWWKCNHGHEWRASIHNRSSGCGCPYCAGQKVLIGYNDLQTINPNLAKEWCFEKNGELKPSNFTANSGKKVWWICNKGHEWEASICNRNKGSGCPYCAGQRLIKGYNDLQTVNPMLANEWNYERNKELTPVAVFSNSGKKVWWKCSKGHEWQAVIASRNSGRGCPECAKQKRSKNKNKD